MKKKKTYPGHPTVQSCVHTKQDDKRETYLCPTSRTVYAVTYIYIWHKSDHLPSSICVRKLWWLLMRELIEITGKKINGIYLPDSNKD